MSTYDTKYNRLPDGRHIWLIQADEKIWHWNKILDHSPYRCDWGGDNWIKSHASRSRILKEVKSGDIGFCYQAAPDKKLLGVARFGKGKKWRTWDEKKYRGLIFWLDWWMRVVCPLDYDAICNDEILSGSEKVKLGQGTLFRISPKEAKRLLSLLRISDAELEIISKKLKLPHSLLPTPEGNNDGDDPPNPPKTVTTEVTRPMRDNSIVSDLKHQHGFKCAVCGERLLRKDRYPYAEAHHLQPLGGNHRGPDIKANVIILCPNHHAEFDFRAIAINPRSARIEHVDPANKWRGLRPQGNLSHVGKKYLMYHFELYSSKESPPKDS